MKFTYWANRGVDGTIITLFNYWYKNLEGTKAHNFICSLVLRFYSVQLSTFNLDAGMVNVFLFLNFRYSWPVVPFTRSICHPQARHANVFCPLLYNLYTNNCRRNYSDTHLLKFADDTVLITLLQDGEVDHGASPKLLM